MHATIISLLPLIVTKKFHYSDHDTVIKSVIENFDNHHHQVTCPREFVIMFL